MRTFIILLVTASMAFGCTRTLHTNDYVHIALAELNSMGAFDTPPLELHEALKNHTVPTQWNENGVPGHVRVVSRSLPASAAFALPETREHLEERGYGPMVSAGAYIAVGRSTEGAIFEVHLVMSSVSVPVVHHGASLFHLTSLEDARLVAAGKYRQDLAEAAISPAIRADTNYMNLHIERIIAEDLAADPW